MAVEVSRVSVDVAIALHIPKTNVLTARIGIERGRRKRIVPKNACGMRHDPTDSFLHQPRLLLERAGIEFGRDSVLYPCHLPFPGGAREGDDMAVKEHIARDLFLRVAPAVVITGFIRLLAHSVCAQLP